MRNKHRARGARGPDRIDAFSGFFLLQGSFSFLRVIARVLVSAEHRILCIHDLPSLDYDERLVSSRFELKLRPLQYVWLSGMHPQGDWLHPEGVRPCWNHCQWNRGSIRASVGKFEFQPGTQPGIANLRQFLPKIRLQSTLNLQVVQLQLDGHNLLGKNNVGRHLHQHPVQLHHGTCSAF